MKVRGILGLVTIITGICLDLALPTLPRNQGTAHKLLAKLK